MQKKLAVYAGTFDVLTVGHLWMIEQGARLFENLVVAIGVNPEKRCMFSLDERYQMLTDSTAQFRNVSRDIFKNQFLISYAKSVGAKFILRGIRTETDYEYERTMRNINADIDPDILTVPLMPPREIAEVSSSMVRGLVGPDGWETIVKKYVPEPVFEKLREAHRAKENQAKMA